MRKDFKRIISIVLSMCSFMMFSLNSLAATGTEGFDAEKYVLDELNAFSEINGSGVVFESFSYEPVEHMSEEELKASIKEYVDMMKCALGDVPDYAAARPSPYAVGSYTAKVESMIPAIGWGYINQDFTANVSSSKVSSVSLVGNSYDTGFTLGSWEPNYSWYEISKSKQYVRIYMKGTLNYLWEALNISHACTFVDYFKANGSVLEDTLDDWPD